MYRWSVAAALVAAASVTVAGDAASGSATTFRVRVENVSKADTLKTSTGSAPAAVAPVLYVVSTGGTTLFTPGQPDRGRGLERLAEDGDPGMLAAFLQGAKGVEAVGVVNTPKGAMAPGPIVGGNAYEFTVTAARGAKLTLAMMFGQSNDVFYATAEGIDLFKGGEPVSGDATPALTLWDAGTEVNQEPGVGADQAPRQKAPDTGAAENAPVRRLEDVRDGFTYPAVGEVLKVTITPAPASSLPGSGGQGPRIRN